MARTRGSKNQVGACAKENILAVFTRVGGTAEMAKWAKQNLTEFYKLYARLIPTEITGRLSVSNPRLTYAERVAQERAADSPAEASVANTVQ